MTTEGLTALRLSRHLDASPEKIFDAWLDPQMAARWLFTSPKSESHSARIDPRVGGRWTIVDRRDGTDYTALGEYLEIDRPRRLVFTFGMPQFSDTFAKVTVEIQPQGKGCLLTVRQESVPLAQLQATEQGWVAMFDQLLATLD